jgi:Eukaryotic elongation factor 5A hypusine, DNA-binding OB fold
VCDAAAREAPRQPAANLPILQIPNVTRTDFNLVDVTEDGFVSLMMENGDIREDLQLPSQTEEDNKLAEQALGPLLPLVQSMSPVRHRCKSGQATVLIA